eukprot:8064561-Alexandrium_andersonii.AAC.1
MPLQDPGEVCSAIACSPREALASVCRPRTRPCLSRFRSMSMSQQRSPHVRATTSWGARSRGCCSAVRGTTPGPA